MVGHARLQVPVDIQGRYGPELEKERALKPRVAFEGLQMVDQGEMKLMEHLRLQEEEAKGEEASKLYDVPWIWSLNTLGP